jgi:hypothetical protein
MAKSSKLGLLCFSLVTLVYGPGLAAADEPELHIAPELHIEADAADAPSDRRAYERRFAVAVYGAGQGGAYGGGGIGGRLRWEVIDQWLGVEVFGESFVINSQTDRLRHDHQVGFNLYVPFELGHGFRLRPLFGFCATFSFIEPEAAGGARSDDILFGAHAGLGLEWAFSDWGSVFLDAQGHAYVGHQRIEERWVALDDALALTGLFQANVGVQVHFGGP